MKNHSTRRNGDDVTDDFVRGLVAEDFPACAAFLDYIDGRPNAAVEFAEALDKAKGAWAAEIVNEFGKYLDEHHGESRARSFYRKALAAGVDVRLNLANILSRDSSNWDQAEALYNEVISDGDTDGLNNLAQLLTNRGDTNGAEAVYRRGIQAGDSLARKNYALFLIEEGRLAEAEVQLRQLARDRPQEGLPRLAALLAADGRWSEARDVVTRIRAAGGRVRPSLLRLLENPDRRQPVGATYRAFGHAAQDVFRSLRFRQRHATGRAS